MPYFLMLSAHQALSLNSTRLTSPRLCDVKAAHVFGEWLNLQIRLRRTSEHDFPDMLEIFEKHTDDTPT